KGDLRKAAETMGVRGYCRIDAFIRIFADGRAETLVIEINSLPGITPATAIFHQAAIAGYQPYQFIDELLTFGRQRQSRQVSHISPARDHTAVAPTNVIPPTMTNESTSFQEEVPTSPEPPKPPADHPEATPKWKLILEDAKAFVLNSYFWRNVGVLVGGLLLAFLLLRSWLPMYTNHGEAIELPNFVDMTVEEATKVAEAKGLKIKVIEGPFDPFRKPGLVVQQTPRANSNVKSNRSIYLTALSSEAPDIPLPLLVGNYDYEVYTRKLDALKIQYSVTEQIYDPKQEENTILHFFYDDQKITDEDLRRGVKVPQGSKLDFVVTVRQTGEVSVPNLRCRTFSEAEFIVGGTNLVVGEVIGAESANSKADAFVYKTVPPAGRMLGVGNSITVYLQATRPDDCQ
ncbi:MAG: PASTA domain-containing protein, partial [Bacteroidota bacterium]